MRNSEQSGGFVALLTVACVVGATLQVQIPPSEPACHTAQGVKSTGRNDEGRHTFEYPEWEKCYE